MIQLKNKEFTYTFSAKGAELQSVLHNASQQEFMWNAEPEIWGRHSPVLFPIVGKLKDNTYHYQEKKYSLPQHGFARNLPFTEVQKTENSITFQLKENEETLQNYPFKFIFQIEYKLLQNNVLEVFYRVENSDDKKIWYSLGAHPGFNGCLGNETDFNKMELIFPNLTELHCTTLEQGQISTNKKRVVLKNNRLIVSEELFKNDALILENNQIEEVHFLHSETQKGVKLKSDNWPYFGIWSQKNNAKFVCLEPWHGIADSLNHNQELTLKKGIVSLQPKEEFKSSFTLEFKA